MPFTYEYPRPSVCVDCVVFGLERGDRSRSLKVQVLLIERGRPPFAGTWALPGGFIEIEEPLLDAAFRELQEETGMRPSCLVVAGVYGTPGRDPRGRTISVVYRTIVWKDEQPIQGGDDASRAGWFPLENLPTLAFDHQQIVTEVWEDLRRTVATQPFGKDLLPTVFQWRDLWSLYEAILGKNVSPRQLKAFLIKSGLLRPVEQSNPGEALPTQSRKPALFCFNDVIYEKLRRHGFSPFLKYGNDRQGGNDRGGQ